MPSLHLVIVGLLLVFSPAPAYTSTIPTTGDAVVEVTEDTFDEHVDGNEYVLMFFYAPSGVGCGHCSDLKPVYHDAAEQLRNEGVDALLAKIDATAYTTLASEFGLKGYPTLKWFHNGEPDDYTGQRSTASIVKWVKKRTNAAVRALKNQAEFEAFKKESDSVVVGFFSEEQCAAPDSNDMVQAFNEAAMDSDNIPYATVSFPVLEEGINPPQVVLFKNFDEGKATYNGRFDIKQGSTKWTRSGIESFVRLESLPASLEFLPHTVPIIFDNEGDQNAPNHLILFTSRDLPDFDKHVAALEEAYASYKGDLINVVVDLANIDVTDKIAEAFEITTANIPTLRGFDVNNDIKFDIKEVHPNKQYQPTAEHAEEVAMAFLVG